MDPVEERDIEKLLRMLDEPRVQEKLTSVLIPKTINAVSTLHQHKPKENLNG